VRVAAPAPRRIPAAAPLLAPATARLAGLVLLAAWCAGQWSRLVAPAAPGALLGMLALALALAAGVARVAPGRRRAAALAGGVLAFLAGTLTLAGAPLRLLEPPSWGSLLSGLGQGLEALPGASTPYSGADPWARTVILAGGGLLLAAGVLLAARRAGRPALGSRILAAGPLLLAAGVPAVVLSDKAGVVTGFALFSVLAAYLWLDRIRRADAALALVLAAGAGVAGVALGAVIDARKPWVDYEKLALSLSPAPSAHFTWNHRYGPLDWPRTGQILLRVAMHRPVYLKTEDLDDFDGVRWRHATVASGIDTRGEMPPESVRRPWTQTIRVTDRGLASHELVGAGLVLSTEDVPSRPFVNGSPGTFALSGPLKPGDAYLARVYVPQPTDRQLAAAHGEYPSTLAAYLTLSLPERGRPVDVQFSAYGTHDAPSALLPDGSVTRSEAVVRRSDYGRAYALAQRLAAASDGPYDLVQRVRAFLGRGGFRYDEDVADSARPLERFLFADRRGYCQHFSGAMALLLRMGGIPARVATGFTPGAHDASRNEWVVRDYDAHSWVEAWFPGLGWVTFDPTPTASPALLGPSAGRTIASVGERVTPRKRAVREARPSFAGADRGGGFPLWLAIVLGALGASVLAVAVRAARRAERPATAVDELDRALRRCGRTPAPELTLRQLERRLRGAPEAAAYVRAVREAHYGFGAPASRAQRRALRHELGRGLGLPGRLRALWALPPRRG
jgi:transglutaminase-like putative cysteine protease